MISPRVISRNGFTAKLLGNKDEIRIDVDGADDRTLALHILCAYNVDDCPPASVLDVKHHIKKKDGDIRLCVDYMALNKIMTRDRQTAISANPRRHNGAHARIFRDFTSDEDVTKINLEPGIESSTEGISLQRLLSKTVYTQSQSTGRSSDDTKVEGSDMDLEEKSRPPPRGLSRTVETRTTQAGRISRHAAKRKMPQSDQKDLKASASDTEGRGGQQWTNQDLGQTFYKKTSSCSCRMTH
ncbi:LOW QUALITY PROTEIN: hypothetical protein PHMEG_0003409 [Phytophthora megakarya]|uniref:Uncharacterized protein n=1 Tax=Phytophthora megakarya TaxID=4795 RepID=A0A225WW58_9STRA|nr:LOW QUALITY PROTEIN: hypothetical protein PHMEG_0003409 [Phytophthora megakarya]